MGEQIRIVRQTRLDPAFPLSRRELAGVVATILEALGREGASLEITLVDDSEMARLNAGFMGCPGPTNVLSFPTGHGDVFRGEVGSAGESAYLGELALSVDTLVREAHLYGQPEQVHLARLLAHGVLHLAGYDHGPEMDDLTELAVDRVLLAQAD
ncbi:rRNA maturation RNase YbeY [Pseudodesulfovibrio sp. F-1]|uniref:Endoribonuclease YbeY n=1 Tax=Pseudodesulfovibrio alkaliphilus TaxID=2661613 RepID=A0A7K1KLA7_9BACT|nr:rRNA maturation RNase YbeY [Pseudodesulfovibrio alkaliphilus]MUM76858.1 rRNA maturation RNase YbeY [Pseudodesulfovibrio alkaliphilus]